MKQERNYGIDLLRIIATYMVIVLHVLGQGGIIWNLENTSQNYISAWVLELLAFCAVNCYALISGYVGIYSKFKISNILLMWLQVVLVSVGSLIVFCCAGVEISSADLMNACFPVSMGTYWYFTAYFCLYFLTPFLNKFIHEANGKLLEYMLIVLIFLFSIMPTFFEKDMFLLNNGYSALWLIILYAVGGILRKLYDNIRIKKYVLLCGYFGSVLLTLFSKIVIQFFSEEYSFELYDDFILIRYNSPTMIIASVCLVLLFAKLSVERILRVIKLLAPVSFGVYIIHTEPFIWRYLMGGRFASFIELTSVKFVLAVVFVAIGIFILCAVAEKIRLWLFKTCRILCLCKKIESLIREKIIPRIISCCRRGMAGGNSE